VAHYRAGEIEECAHESRIVLMLDPEDEVAQRYLERSQEVQEAQIPADS